MRNIKRKSLAIFLVLIMAITSLVFITVGAEELGYDFSGFNTIHNGCCDVMPQEFTQLELCDDVRIFIIFPEGTYTIEYLDAGTFVLLPPDPDAIIEIFDNEADEYLNFESFQNWCTGTSRYAQARISRSFEFIGFDSQGRPWAFCIGYTYQVTRQCSACGTSTWTESRSGCGALVHF